MFNTINSLLEKVPITPEKQKLLAQGYLRKGFYHIAPQLCNECFGEVLEPLPAPIQLYPLVTSNKAIVDKVYCTESDYNWFYIYCTYTNHAKIPLWTDRKSVV